MLWILLTLFSGAALAPAIYRRVGDYAVVLLAALPVCAVAWSSQHWQTVISGDGYHEHYEWAPSLGVNVAFHIDALAMVFVLLICGIGALVLLYASKYLYGDHRLGLFYGYLLFFMASMVGLVLADNIFLVFVFWELTSVSSYLLIGWNHSTAGSRNAARTSLIITGGGGMMLMAGLVLLSLISETSTISAMSGDLVRENPRYLLMLLLILGGAFTKSAQFPFHFWLPGAMAAPTPVSAYLHSATMVKAGVYLLARLHPTIGSTDAWFAIVTTVGGVTMLVGAIVSVTQVDLKRILAYSTISVLGTLTMLLGIGTEGAVWAAVAYLVAHSLYKGTLFLVAGSLDHETGSRDITQLRGLARLMPITAVAAVLAAASSAGMPPLLGFLAKELLYEAAWHAPAARFVLLPIAFVASVLMGVVGLMVAYRPFFGGPASAPNLPHEAPWRMWLGPATLGIASLLAGLVPLTIQGLLQATVEVVYGEPAPLELKLWHGFTLILGLSIFTLVAAVGTYILIAREPSPLQWIATRLSTYNFQRGYDRAYEWTMQCAEAVTGIVQNGYLRNYILVVVLSLLALLSRPLLQGHELFLQTFSEIHTIEVILAVVIFVAALVTTMMVSRLAIAAILGVIGISVMLLYVIFGALDLAVTQIMVETLTVIVLVLVLYHLPRFVNNSSRWVYFRDACISVVFGGMIALLVAEAFSVNSDPSLREFYAANSYLQAHGRNVVNVILVDFRAADTMGEITVLTVAAIGVYALLRIRTDRRERSGAMISLVLRAATPVLMLLLLVVSIYALLRGHHESGGGFVGGLLGAAAFALHSLAHDVPSTRRLLRVAPHKLMGAGLAIAALSGMIGLAVGGSFLQGEWINTFLPGFGYVHVGTPLLFDIGVYAVVMGMVLTIILTAAEE